MYGQKSVNVFCPHSRTNGATLTKFTQNVRLSIYNRSEITFAEMWQFSRDIQLWTFCDGGGSDGGSRASTIEIGERHSVSFSSKVASVILHGGWLFFSQPPKLLVLPSLFSLLLTYGVLRHCMLKKPSYLLLLTNEFNSVLVRKSNGSSGWLLFLLYSSIRHLFS